MNEARPARIVVTPAAVVAEGPPLLAPDRALIEPQQRRSTTFWIALALAALLHVTPFLASALGVVWLAPMRRMGEPDGDPAAISVETVDEATLASLSTPPAQQPPPAPAAPEMRGTAAPQSPPKEPPPQPQSAEKTPPPTAPEPNDMLKEMTELFAPDPAPKSRPPAPAKVASPQSPPPANAAPSVLDTPMEFQANSSSVARPVDATRSGENDDFGRGVIKALRQTMPAPWGLRSRVTVKFLLSESGQVIEIQLVRSSGYPVVDQSVVFAAKNSTFPIPPIASKLADRIFMVTYIYE